MTNLKTASRLRVQTPPDSDLNKREDARAQDKSREKSKETSQTGKRVCRTVILLDEPETDVAKGGPHERIADNIAALIVLPNAKGMSIGLEGSWGSGKSTVARLLAKKLAGDKSIALISFDAWAHEGDPLRRTFLETLIKRLKGLNSWIDNSFWGNKIEELANRREVVTTKDTLDITPWGRVIVFLLPLVPIGGAFIAAALREPITLVPGSPAWKSLILFFVGLALTFTPALVLLWRFRKEPGILNVFFNKGPTEKTTQTSRTVNPTSVEFEENFTALVEQALKGNQKRIVLVLDNLDRVDADDALIIWSTLQTFLQHRDTERPAWRDRLWIIVLYDLDGLSLLWEGKSDETKGARTAASFIDKSFQIRFEVPALVLSDWRSFLMAKLQEAFPDHSETDLHEVYRVMAIAFAGGNRLPTIRELKLYVNQIGAIHRQWAGSDGNADTFPLAHIAYYVLLRRKNQVANVINQLVMSQDQMFPPREYRDLLGGGVRENLAAISFNVDVGVAQQLLFTDRIKNALTLGSDEELRKIQSVIPRGFWETFEQIVTNVTAEWTGGEMVKIADAAWALERSGLLAEAPPPSVRLLTRSICQQASAVESWSPLDEKKAQGLATIINWKNEAQTGADPTQLSEFIQGIFRGASLGLRADASRTGNTISAESWLESLTIVLKDLQPAFKVKALETVVETLSSQLKLVDPLHARELEIILEVLSELESQPDAELVARNSLKDLSDTGQIARQLSKAPSATANSVAWGLYVLFRHAARVELSSLVEDPPPDPVRDLVFSSATIKVFTETLERFDQLPLLFTVLATNDELKPIVVSALKLALKSPSASQLFNTPDAIDRLEFITTEMAGSDEEEATLAQLITDVSSNLQLATGLSTRSFNPESAKLYLLILDNLGEHNENFVMWCINGLKRVTTKAWAAQFKASGKLLHLALRLNPPDGEVDLGVKYFNALKEYTDEIIAEPSEVFPLIFPGNVARLLGQIDGELRGSFRDHLCFVGKSTSSLHPSFFDQFGIELATQLLQSAQGERILELFNSIVDQRDVKGLRWISDAVSKDAQALLQKYSGEAAFTSFRNKVRRVLPTNTKPSPLSLEALSRVQSIANAMKIEAIANGNIAFSALDVGRWRLHVVNAYGSERGLFEIAEKVDSDEKMQPALSPDGSLLAYTARPGAQSEVRVVDVQRGKRVDLFIATDKRSFSPTWAADGKTLAFVKGNEEESHIYSIQMGTNEERNLTPGSGKSGHPSWSPDGDRIVFHKVGSDERSQILVMNADGTEHRAITDGPHDFDPSWSNDGTRIAIARRHHNKVSMLIVDPSGTELDEVIEEPHLYNPVWSPEGDKILFQVGLMDDSQIFEIGSDGTNKKLLGAGIDPSWQPLKQLAAS